MRGLIAIVGAPIVVGALITSAHAQPAPNWTAGAVVEAPRIIQTAISADGTFAAYIVRHDHLAGNVRDSTLVEVDLARGTTRTLLTARWISNLSAVPKEAGWSALADVGDGVQLYSLDRSGHLTPEVISKSLLTISADPTRSPILALREPEESFGVLDYGWAPNGKALWYSCATIVAPSLKPGSVIEMPTVPKVTFPANRSELHVIDADGADHLVATSRGFQAWPTVFYGYGAASWRSEERGLAPVLQYDVPAVGEGGNRTPSNWHFDLTTHQSMKDTADVPPNTIGTYGGELAVTGPWAGRHLVKREPGGAVRDFGAVHFSINSGWNPGVWQVADASFVILAVRYDGLNVRNSLIKVSADGTMSDLEAAVSLDRCAFSENASTGICIRQGINEPPSLVAIDGRQWTQRVITSVDPRYQAIAPLTFEPRVWEAGGHQASGFVVYPRGYQTGKRYPAILMTHGYDADNTFVNTDFQWNYPAQVFAERGYVVIYVNDIPMAESDERLAAYTQWATGAGTLAGTRVQDIVWLDQLSIYQHAIQDLVGDGIVDALAVGFAGYSRGSQMADVAVTQTDWFKASSSGDGAIFAPSSYWMGDNYKIYGMLFEGSPFEARYRQDWERLAPAFRAKPATAAVLFQMATVGPGMVDFFQALKAAGAPTEFVFLPGETHLPNVPADRLMIMNQNLDWFDFWLKNIEDPDPAKAGQYRRWGVFTRPAGSADGDSQEAKPLKV